jgi:uncharacterized protein (DUF1330 family)
LIAAFRFEESCLLIGSRGRRSTIRRNTRSTPIWFLGIIAKYGGKVLARGGRFQIMEGPDKFGRFVVIEFPTFEQGVACFKSDEYNKAAAFRRANGAGEVETIMVDGGDATK